MMNAVYEEAVESRMASVTEMAILTLVVVAASQGLPVVIISADQQQN